MNERRAVRRIAPDEPLKAKVYATFPVRVLDISERGAQLEVERSLRPNVGCELRFPSPDGEYVMRATVRRCRAWGFAMSETDQRVLVFRAGVEFDSPHPELLRKLQLSAEPEPSRQSIDIGLATVGQAAQGVFAEAVEVTAEAASTAADLPPLPQGPTAAPPAPRGPVKIRIRSDHVRRILQS
ncbi:MAG: PilZ domain-containing protein [Acidobacteriota bacterium]|jgi:hypothetical protein